MSATAIDFGRRTWWAGQRVLVDVRTVGVTLALLVVTIVMAIFAVATGTGSVGAPEVIDLIRGVAKPSVEMVVVQWRMPRVLLAVAVGACLAIAGAIFQTLTVNPLGSPDVIGFQTGAYTGALVVMLIIKSKAEAAISGGALIAGLITAVVVYLLSVRRGRSSPARLIIVGLGVSAALASLNTWMLLNAEVEDALMASLWGAGSLAGANWNKTTFMVVLGLVWVTVSLFLSRPLALLQVGESTATGLGQRVRLVQLAAVVVGIGLTAVATATTGPIAFIALAAPQIARKLTRQVAIPFVASAAVGATLLVLADILAQRLHAATPLPVGLVTVSIGGLYFLWLLLRERKRR